LKNFHRAKLLNVCTDLEYLEQLKFRVKSSSKFCKALGSVLITQTKNQQQPPNHKKKEKKKEREKRRGSS
jgi:hypothetical protein